VTGQTLVVLSTLDEDRGGITDIDGVYTRANPENCFPEIGEISINLHRLAYIVNRPMQLYKEGHSLY